MQWQTSKHKIDKNERHDHTLSQQFSKPKGLETFC